MSIAKQTKVNYWLTLAIAGLSLAALNATAQAKDVINQGKPTQQVFKDDSKAYNTVHGDIKIGITLDQYKQDLKQGLAEQKLQLQALHAKEKDNLQLKNENLSLKIQLAEKAIQEKTEQLANLDESYQARIRFLNEQIVALKALKPSQTPDLQKQTDSAIAALTSGDTSQADQLFAEIQSKADSAIKLAANAAYQRGKIALSNQA